MKPGGQGDSDVLLSDYLVLAWADFRWFRILCPFVGSSLPAHHLRFRPINKSTQYTTGTWNGGLGTVLKWFWMHTERGFLFTIIQYRYVQITDCLRKLWWILILMIYFTFCETEQFWLRPSDFLQRGADLGYDKVQSLFQFGIYSSAPWDCCQGCKRIGALQELGRG